MTCLCKGPFVVVLICGLGLLSLLIIFCTSLIFLFWRLEKAYLIFNISLAVLDLLDDAWA